MAHIGALPGLQRLITTHNAEGKAIFSTELEGTAPWDGSVEGGSAAFSLSYMTDTFPVDLNGDKDLQVYKNALASPPGLVNSGGSVLRLVDMKPGNTSPMHRTVSLDYGVVLVGEIELVLDSGETKLMKPGDMAIQRGTMHAWRNTSATEWGRMLFVLQPSLPLELNGAKLGEDLSDMSGVKASS